MFVRGNNKLVYMSVERNWAVYLVFQEKVYCHIHLVRASAFYAKGRVFRDKHSSLFCRSISDGEESVFLCRQQDLSEQADFKVDVVSLKWVHFFFIKKNFQLIVTDYTMGLYHPLDGITNLKYKLLYLLTPNKKNFQRERHWLLTGIDAAI